MNQAAPPPITTTMATRIRIIRLDIWAPRLEFCFGQWWQLSSSDLTRRASAWEARTSANSVVGGGLQRYQVEYGETPGFSPRRSAQMDRWAFADIRCKL